ncbi:MAG TPA: hypothetical protein VFD05_02540 [Bacilli bacterium]|nr:hypothetical protein [Bacilli bacterium]
MKPRTNKFRNILKLLPIAFLLFGFFTLTSRTVNNQKALSVSATSTAYGEFSLPDEAKWIYVHSNTGSDASSRTGRSISSPLKQLLVR